jgi:hypothetical protein
MKHFYIYLLLFCLTWTLPAQTNGISYQAVLVDNNPQEIPGVDIPSNNLPNKEIEVQFSILGQANQLEYQERHETRTDAFGMIHLMIGQGEVSADSPGFFEDIYWADEKRLEVKIDLGNGQGFLLFSTQTLSYIPYVKHREIIATSTLDVEGETNLYNALTVNNASPTLLTGDLNVIGQAYFKNGNFENLDVTEETNLNSLNVVGKTELIGDVSAYSFSEFLNQVVINYDGTGDNEDTFGDYPFQLIGGQQGMAIKLSPNTPNESNNYISFWDGSGESKGRIEGKRNLVEITTDAIYDLIDIPNIGDIIDADENDEAADVEANQYFLSSYAFGAYQLTLELVKAAIRFGINATAAAGACITGDCDDAIWSFIDMTVAGIQLGGYITYNEINMGVAFESGGADYAEWLQKANTNEIFTYGDVVGVIGGKISKGFKSPDNYMVISANPMVSGAMPDKASMDNYEQVAFLGQVPVKVIGPANVGDYIVASGNKDGFAMAIPKNKMSINHYPRIVGIAWSEATENTTFNYIQTAIGVSTNDLKREVEKMQRVLNSIQESLSKLDPEFKSDFFEVLENANEDPKENSVTLQEEVADQTNAMSYGSLKEALGQIQTRYQKDKTVFDISRMPYMRAMIENPNRENAEKIVSYYTKVLDYLNARQEDYFRMKRGGR